MSRPTSYKNGCDGSSAFLGSGGGGSSSSIGSLFLCCNTSRVTGSSEATAAAHCSWMVPPRGWLKTYFCAFVKPLYVTWTFITRQPLSSRAHWNIVVFCEQQSSVRATTRSIASVCFAHTLIRRLISSPAGRLEATRSRVHLSSWRPPPLDAWMRGRGIKRVGYAYQNSDNCRKIIEVERTKKPNGRQSVWPFKTVY